MAGHCIIIGVFYVYNLHFYFEGTLNHMSILIKLSDMNLEESALSSDLGTFVMHSFCIKYLYITASYLG